MIPPARVGEWAVWKDTHSMARSVPEGVCHGFMPGAGIKSGPTSLAAASMAQGHG